MPRRQEEMRAGIVQELEARRLAIEDLEGEIPSKTAEAAKLSVQNVADAVKRDRKTSLAGYKAEIATQLSSNLQAVSNLRNDLSDARPIRSTGAPSSKALRTS